MYIVNTTFVVEPASVEAWLELIRGKYIPFLQKNSVKISALTRVISAEPVEHFTYSLQVEAADIPSYEKLTGELFAEYLAAADEMFGSRVLYFTSLLKKEEF